MKEQILKLRNEGKTYNEIKKELGCSKGTISYHCGYGQKEKNNNRLIKFRNNNPIKSKTDKFRGFEFKCRDFNKIENNNKLQRSTLNFSYEDVINYIGENPICYLTGRNIDINKTSSYHFDHIIPRKQGGDNSLENLGIACRDANMAKSDLTVDEFINLCKEVLEFNGYKVSKE